MLFIDGICYLQMVFIDFSKNFDSVNRKAMLRILSMCGIPEKIIAAIKRTYENAQTFVDTTKKDCEHEAAQSLNGNILKQVDDFKYLGSYIWSSKRDFEIKKTQAWVACNKLHTIWTTGISTQTKINLFKTFVECTLLYGSETWAMPKLLEKRLDGTYTRLLMRVQNINWKQHFTLEQIYGNLPKASDVFRMRRNRFAGHCIRAKEEIIFDLLFWFLTRQKRGRKPLSYLETLVSDNDTDITDLVNIMENRNLWNRLVDSHLDCGRRK